MTLKRDPEQKVLAAANLCLRFKRPDQNATCLFDNTGGGLVVVICRDVNMSKAKRARLRQYFN